MESEFLKLYACEFALGKKSNSGFPNSSHNAVAHNLYYDTMMACKATSGFQCKWKTCEVTASDVVWKKYLKLHQHAQKFRGKPFPEFNKLEILFGPKTAMQDLSPNSLQVVDQCQRDVHRSREGPVNMSPARDLPVVNALSSSVTQPVTQSLRSHLRDCPPVLVTVKRAMDLYLDFHMCDATTKEALAIFEIFCDCNGKSALKFSTISNKELCSKWLKDQLERLDVEN
ncbi:hypothetical protein PCASD_12372 [Puccinia coronata f. sp. avenae]|uniref:Uncharacterized protein n=1 Tax=Puccinia coronata f. sp. avenae TaxID=200324 RepID=A0A2N5TDY7_9BASI|nr:hypothetical protein PCASD_12372 [Puccinia coronata f. sp. avenae]